MKGDLSALRSVAVIRTGVNGVMYQDIAFRIVLHFGGPELKAQLHWFENVSQTCLLKCRYSSRSLHCRARRIGK